MTANLFRMLANKYYPNELLEIQACYTNANALDQIANEQEQRGLTNEACHVRVQADTLRSNGKARELALMQKLNVKKIEPLRPAIYGLRKAS